MPRDRQKLFLEGSIGRALVRLAIPIVLGNVLQTGYQLTDAFWVGRLGAAAVAAVSVSFPVTFLVIALGAGLAMGSDALGAIYGGGAPGHGQSCRGPDHDDGGRHLRLPGRGRLSAGALSAGAAGCGPRCLQRRARLHARRLRRHHLRLPLCHVPGADARRRPDADAAADRHGSGHPELHPRSAFHLRLGAPPGPRRGGCGARNLG